MMNVRTVGTVRTGSSSSSSSLLQNPRPTASLKDAMDRPQRTASSTSLWRPWTGSVRNKLSSCPYSRPASAAGCSDGPMKPHSFQHPVRLMWPRSKTFDFLYSDGATLLRNFPVQATISFYEESDSEDDDEDDEEEEEEDKCVRALSHHFTSQRN